MDRRGKQSERSRAAAHFDEMTLAVFAVLLFAVIAVVFRIGMATAEDRLGCGLNDIVGVVMAYPGGCH